MEMFTEWLDNTEGEKSWKKSRRALRSQPVGQITLSNTLNLSENNIDYDIATKYSAAM